MRAEPVVLAQLTDTHISVGSHAPGEKYWAENARRLRTAIRHLNAETEAPSVVLGTGDLVECGQQPAYDLLVEILDELRITFWPLPGNHDSPERMRAAFPYMKWSDGHSSWSQVIEGTDVSVIGFDTTIRGESGGYVDVDRLDWLADEIESAEGPVILAMHHPPFLTGIDWMDGFGFHGMQSLQELLVEYPPTRILAGHFHRSITSQVGSTAASVGIATAPHVNLDLSNASIPAVIDDPIGYQLHCVLPDEPATVISHTRFIDRAAVARPIQL